MTTQLSTEQFEATGLTGNRCVIMAGAGSGKTRTLAATVARHQAEGTDPRRQIVVTFTNKAANEIRERLGDRAEGMKHCGTLHSWALRELRRNEIQNIGDLEVIGDKDYTALIKEEIERLRLKDMTIAKAKEFAVLPRGLTGNPRVIGAAIMARCIAEGKVHPDLILGIFAGNFDAIYLEPGTRIYVDEYQDTGRADEKIYKAAMDRGARLFVVGDLRQAIYGFRGASPVMLWNAWSKAGEGERAELRDNYRSGQAIVDLANRIAASLDLPDGVDPTMICRNPIEASMTRYEYATAEAEAESIATWLKHDAPPEKTAILARYNDQARLIAGVLRGNGIECNCSADFEEIGESLMSNEEMIKLANRNFSGDWEHHGDWADHLTDAGVPFEIQDRILPALGRCAAKEDVLAVLRGELEHDPALVTVSTIHSAKGLEWPIVWLAGADHKAIPDDQESRRLAYVAVTRCEQVLITSHASSRQQHTRLTKLEPTRTIEI